MKRPPCASPFGILFAPTEMMILTVRVLLDDAELDGHCEFERRKRR